MADDTCAVDAAPKRRACDECRFRKIACSKEPGGCARCEREGIQCHYSPQKPMGRPRKRRLVDLEDPQRPVAEDTTEYAAAANTTTDTTTTAASSVYVTDPVNDYDVVDYDYLAAPVPSDDGFNVAGICETIRPDPSRQLFDVYDWSATNGGMSFIDLLPDFPPESPDILDQGDPASMAFMQGLESGSGILAQQPGFDGLPSLCSSPMNTLTCPRSTAGRSNNDNSSNNHSQTVCTPPAQSQCTGYRNNNSIGTPPYQDDHQTPDPGYRTNGLGHHAQSVNTPPHTACSSPDHGAYLSSSCVRACRPSSDASSPSCRGRCQKSCQNGPHHAPHPLSTAPHLHPTPQPTPQSRPHCQSHPVIPSLSPSPSPSQCPSQFQFQSESDLSTAHARPKALGIPCTCLSSIYFALNSLAQLPTHIPSAIRTARHASKMAYQVINCPECYDVTIVDPSKQPPIQCFQNLMCLGSLVPAACNAYVSILRMVDVETDRARAEKRKLWFSLGELGGSWTTVLPSCHGEFLRKCNDKYIPPDVWRTAIRRILRLDVHGAEGGSGSGIGGGGFAASFSTPLNSTSASATPCSQPEDPVASEVEPHQPLKGVITLLDEKNRRRHAQIDHLITMGRMPENSPYLLFPGGHKVVPTEARNCSHMLETARLALSNLSIA